MSKFNFKTVKGSRKYRPWKEWSEGDSLVAYLRGEYEDKFKKTCYEVEVIECEFEEEDSNFKEKDIVGLNSMGSLNYKLEDVELGSVIRIEYTGEITLEKGPYEGKTAHSCEVQIAEDAPKKVAPAPVVEEEEEGDYDL